MRHIDLNRFSNERSVVGSSLIGLVWGMESGAARFVTKRYVVGDKAMYKAYSDDLGNSYQERV